MKKKILILIIILINIIIEIKAQKIDTLKLYFDIDKNTLTTDHKLKIDALFEKLKNFTINKIEIKGYTDYLASVEYNKQLSTKRAMNVKQYLLEKRASKFKFTTEGKGKLPPELVNDKNGVQENRKVEIIAFYYKEETETATENPIKSVKENNIEKPKDTNISQKAEAGELSQLIEETDVGKNIILKNVNFYPGRHFPMIEAKPALEELVQVMKDNPKLEIEIQGHICCVDYEHDCLDLDTKKKNLSKERAKYVYYYLIRNGINKNRLKHNGYGAKYKIYKEEIDEEERLQNRRVEIKIIKK